MARILIVDGDTDFVGALTAALKECGHTVARLSDGRKALATARAWRFDLILTDLSVPQKDGYETIRDLRNAGMDLPIIAMSGLSDMTVALNMAKRFGATATLTKPFDLTQLRAAIDKVLGEKQRKEAA